MHWARTGQTCPQFVPILPLFFPIFCPCFGDPREGRVDVAILSSPHHGDPEKAGVM